MIMEKDIYLQIVKMSLVDASRMVSSRIYGQMIIVLQYLVDCWMFYVILSNLYVTTSESRGT